MNKETGKIGLWRTTSLVAGNMIASGIFMLPVALASFGSISLIGWILSGIGAVLMATVFAWSSRLYPGARGGPYAYAREGLGSFAAFLVAWSYWISVWTTNAAISVGFVSYLSVFFPWVSSGTVPSLITGLSAIWLLTWINCRGIPTAGSVQLFTTILKILPLVLIICAGIFFIETENFAVFNVSGQSNFGAITSTATLTLFAFLGLESATIPGASVHNPERTIPKATMIGTLLVTAVYILGTVAVMGILPGDILRQSNAPFADAAALMWGEQARYWVAGGAVISTFGALNGWMLMQGQMPASAAADHLLPKFFGQLNKKHAPSGSIIISSILITILLVMNSSGKLATTFKFIILISTLTALIAYLLSMAAYIIVAPRYVTEKKKLRIHLIVAFGGFLYALWAVAGAGEGSVYYGLLAVLAGIPIYAFQKIKIDKRGI